MVEDLVREGPERVVDRMSKSLDDPKLQALCCQALINLSSNNTVVQGLIGQQLGGIHLVVRSIVQHLNEEKVQEKGIGVLCSLTLVPSNRSLIGSLHGEKLAMEAMKRFPESPGVAVESSTLMANVAFGSRGNKIWIGRNGGILAILKAMQDFPDHRTLQMRGCLALRNIAWGVEDNQAMVSSLGGVVLLYRAIENHVSDSSIIEQSSVALCNVVLSTENESSPGDVTILLSAMDLHRGNSIIQEHCVVLIDHMVGRQNVCQQEFLKAFGIKTIIEGMKVHSENRGVLLKASRLLKRLAGVPEFRNQIFDYGGIELLADILCLTLNGGSEIIH
uniref:LRRK2 ARM repeat domain-containing protein n=1 Tax=Compsopogon caeruleus TaxID=31354 RepID=A0A7S1T776_9RHOD